MICRVALRVWTWPLLSSAISSIFLCWYEFVCWVLLKFAIAFGLSGGRGEMSMAAPPRGFSSCSVHQTLSLLVPVQRQSIELPATTVGECRRRRSLRRHKGGLWTVRLSSFHRVLLQGGFFSLCRRDLLA